MLRLKCIGGPLYGQEYCLPYNEFTFSEQQTGKETLYRKLILDFTPPQAFFIAESISPDFAYALALQLMGQQSLS
jgi:hypothetical protein